MAEIVNCMDQHIRILRTAKNGRLEVTRFYPAGVMSSLQLQPDEAECGLDGVPVQPVRSVIADQPDLGELETAYIVDMDVAVSLVERGEPAFLLVPCDPFLVRELPKHTDEAYTGEYKLIQGGLVTDDAVRELLDAGYKVYGYRRLLLIYCDAKTVEEFIGLNNQRVGRTVSQDRLRVAVRKYYDAHQKWLKVQLADLRVKQREVDAVLLDGSTQTFRLNDADVSRLMIFLDSLLQN